MNTDSRPEKICELDKDVVHIEQRCLCSTQMSIQVDHIDKTETPGASTQQLALCTHDLPILDDTHMLGVRILVTFHVLQDSLLH